MIAPVKIAVLGYSGVGKSALIVRFITRRFIGEYCPTLENTYSHSVKIEEETILVEILDTAGGDEDWKDVYATWADCFVFVYSVDDRRGFENIQSLKQRIEGVSGRTSVFGVLIGSKNDLDNDRQVTFTEGAELADEIGCQFYETSSADGSQILFITEIFRGLVRHYLQRRRSSFRKPITATARERLHAWAKVFQQKNKKVQRINSFCKLALFLHNQL